ncbi:MAG TPA: hypothetical protein VN643_08820 [Pyrinomonadaceae bacterium]|nr:hypothetical protein [Pyrinomonadaceae bacterium]
MATLTEQEFSKHTNTDFRVKLDTPEPINLRLVEVKGYAKKDEEHGGMERFSLFFTGPATVLPQKTYSLSHDEMGEFELFLVPIAREGEGFRYESVFNYFIQPS